MCCSFDDLIFILCVDSLCYSFDDLIFILCADLLCVAGFCNRRPGQHHASFDGPKARVILCP